MTLPECSVCLSTRNKSEYLKHSLASIFRQNPPFPFEVIVVDDGSTDNTEEICSQYPIRYFYLDNPRYRNPSQARNVAFRAAKGNTVLAQSDDIIHLLPNTMQYLTENLELGTFLLGRTHNYEYKKGKPFRFKMEYCGPLWQKPYFFLGAISRKDICAVGGYDEEFTEPCFDDNWFADCLIHGLNLKPKYTNNILAHHQSHGYEVGSHSKEHVSRKLYRQKVDVARKKNLWLNSGGSWVFEPENPVVQPPDREQALFNGPFLPKVGRSTPF